MPNDSRQSPTLSPKICHTAAAFLYDQGQVLLVKHRKLNAWLAPGGHLDENELPDDAAARELFEETGLEVKIVSQIGVQAEKSNFADHGSEFLPVPFAVNLHWVCRENYQLRLNSLKEKKPYTPVTLWPKGCEKHLNFSYLAQLVNPKARQLNASQREVIEAAWFTAAEIETLWHKKELFPDIYQELLYVFKLTADNSNKGQ